MKVSEKYPQHIHAGAFPVSQFIPNEPKTVQQGGYLTMIWRESCNFPGFQPGGNRIAGAQRRRMRRGQESPWLKFMENKGRSLIEWSENYPAGQLTQLTMKGQTGNAPV
jgi:hypothetical protein